MLNLKNGGNADALPDNAQQSRRKQNCQHLGARFFVASFACMAQRVSRQRGAQYATDSPDYLWLFFTRGRIQKEVVRHVPCGSGGL